MDGSPASPRLSDRFLLKGSEVGVWHYSAPRVVGSGGGRAIVEVRARWLVSGNVEFGLRVDGLRVWFPLERYFLYSLARPSDAARRSSVFDTGAFGSVCWDGALDDITGGGVSDYFGLLSDCEALLASRGVLEGGSGHLSGWAPGAPLGGWVGVAVAGRRVAVLDLDSYKTGFTLTGSIPPALGRLSGLRELSLESNELTGVIPPELGGLSGLGYLYLHENLLTGSIPPELGDILGLMDLRLGSNYLTGGIPGELGDLVKLRNLFLDDNALTGGIPVSLARLVDLEYLVLYFNRLSGVIPGELGDLSKLVGLYLNDNLLTGGIPASLGELPVLMELHLQANFLSGEIPSELGRLGERPDPASDLRFFHQFDEESIRMPYDNPDLGGCVPDSLNKEGVTVYRGYLEWCQPTPT